MNGFQVQPSSPPLQCILPQCYTIMQFKKQIIKNFDFFIKFPKYFQNSNFFFSLIKLYFS